MLTTPRSWPWFTVQIIAANVVIILALASAWYWLFSYQSMVYSERLMSTFNIQPGQLHQMFVQDVERQLWTSVTLGLVFAVLASVGMAFVIVSPLRSLAQATERLRQGDYSVRSLIKSGEVGMLARNFNDLAAELEKEDKRRAQYLADLGHELRTPITSLRGYTEGLEDGVFKADKDFFALMSSELHHLTALTHSIEAMELGDEYQSQTAAGAPVQEALLDMERRWRDLFAQRRLSFTLSLADNLKEQCFAVSAKSLRHIVDNLMLNMVRYADEDAPCQVNAVRTKLHQIKLEFVNGASDLPAGAVPMLFDRFFRVSASRTRARDGHSNGLGLSIVKQLCLKSRGTAEASLEAGRLHICVNLPLSKCPK